MKSLFDVKYNLKVYTDNIAKQSKKEVIEEGIEKGIVSMIEGCKEFEVTFSSTIKRISKEFNLTMEESENKVKEYWK